MLLKVVPLGGLGHIGGNMMVYETAEDMWVVDCGVLFPTAQEPGVEYVVPQVQYIEQRRAKLRGYVLTHGHEDHIGALPFVLPLCPAPLYATQFTADLIRLKMLQHPTLVYTLHEIRDRAPFHLGRILIDPIPVTHSIPQAIGLAMRTPAGIVVHTGDFKLDPTPLDGRATDEDAFRAYGELGVTLLLSDSTNAERQGRTWSELDIAACMQEEVAKVKGRAIVTTFASHIERIQGVLDAAAACNRKVLPIGRSMMQNVQLGLDVGYLRADVRNIGVYEDVLNLPPEQTLVLASGSQGEPRSAMGRMASGQLRPDCLAPGDTVLLSSRRIPGNERAIGNMINAFYRQGAEVIDDHQAKIHSSGHAFRDEQADMLKWTKPRFFVPLHGELRHMRRHGSLAMEHGVAPASVFVTEDGSPLCITRKAGELALERLASVPAGLRYIEGNDQFPVGELLLRERHLLAESGVVFCSVAYDEQRRLLAPPQVYARGLVEKQYTKTVTAEAEQLLLDALLALESRPDAGSRDECIRRVLRNYFKRVCGKRPLIVPSILDSDEDALESYVD